MLRAEAGYEHRSFNVLNHVKSCRIQERRKLENELRGLGMTTAKQLRLTR